MMTMVAFAETSVRMLTDLAVSALPQSLAFATTRPLISSSQVGDRFKLGSCFCSVGKCGNPGARQEAWLL